MGSKYDVGHVAQLKPFGRSGHGGGHSMAHGLLKLLNLQDQQETGFRGAFLATS